MIYQLSPYNRRDLGELNMITERFFSNTLVPNYLILGMLHKVCTFTAATRAVELEIGFN